VAEGDLSCSVVIPVYNGAQTLARCLLALRNQSLTSSEVIVVDDGSTDASGTIARRLGAQVVAGPRSGPAAARNRGIEAASSPIILFTDADCTPHEDWIENMLTAFQDPDVAGCKGSYSSAQQSISARFVQLDYEDRYRRMKRRQTIDFVDTYSAGYRRGILHEMGGFDESYRDSSVEDQELAFRVAAAGHRLIFVPSAAVEHRHPSTLAEYAKRKFKIGYYKPKLHRRHRARLLRDSHTPLMLRVQTALATILIVYFPLAIGSMKPRRLWLYGLLGITASAAPLSLRNGRKDGMAGVVTPAFVVLRAFALASGLLVGGSELIAGELLRSRSRWTQWRRGLAQSMPRQGVQKWLTPKTD